MNLFSKFKKVEQEIAPQNQEDLKARNVLDSIKGSTAFIEFKHDGTIIDVNENFLNVVGYTRNEVLGKHHRIFCDRAYSQSSDYQSFWQKLSQGQSFTDKFKRITKNNQEVWLEASYIPVKGEQGQVDSIVKIASDITEFVERADTQNGVLSALDRSTATISFALDGTILEANDNFLQAMQYSLDEIKGKHHKIFCSKELTSSPECAEFWRKLNSGQFVQGMFERRTANGDVVWLEASYNPIFDNTGKLVRIVKFASDITARVANLKNASEAVQSTVVETEQVSEVAKEVLNDSVNIMDEITGNVENLAANITGLANQSDKISDIVNTISSIADQTNLLALNAAIEAARAGEMGRGFAVVADEVRSLAARTSASTAEISEVVKNNQTMTTSLNEDIQLTQEKSEAGAALIAQVDGVFKEINAGMQGIVSSVDNLS
ncbi:methyl-accepting chemotaxis protein [Thalassotalea euphylliae]|uniref:PAS domain-containing protein n=1 Tax=Thalassotalea euphylliae TaxID=1655234 RepID=A0A3E0TZD6_9GAMM|nr:PAS domain-containing methyl-accepting chemotaxis protein [Thalassotalea euphylliae]REL30008.1 PAS domain-containing protein [Thalassotalea euphylliae]